MSLSPAAKLGEEMEIDAAKADAAIKYLRGQAADGYRQFGDAVKILKISDQSLRLVFELYQAKSILLDPKTAEQVLEALVVIEKFLQTGEVPDGGSR